MNNSKFKYFMCVCEIKDRSEGYWRQTRVFKSDSKGPIGDYYAHQMECGEDKESFFILNIVEITEQDFLKIEKILEDDFEEDE